ncbi:MAG: aminotransferase class I/II-fold pyridoxal phosphate-dependent enzyme, partial [Myxococcota bacterium]
MSLSPLTQTLGPSPTLSLRQRVGKLQRSGRSIENMSVGEPDLPLHPEIQEAAIRAIREQQNGYTAVPGQASLRQALAQQLSQRSGTPVTPDQVLYSAGAKQCLAQALMCLVHPGDEVIVLAPLWPSYLDQIALAKGKPVVVQTMQEQGYTPSIAQIEQAISPRTRCILLNSPNNPTGAVYPASLLKDIAKLVQKHDIWLISDEIYEHYIYPPTTTISVLKLDPLPPKTLYVSGFSKTYSMTGWRLGYMVGPPELITACAHLQGALTSGACVISQWAGLAALSLPQEFFTHLK